jgi:peptidoglycan-associated lipoprotein
MGSVEHFIEGAPDRVYFAYDKSDLNNEALSALQRQAAWLGLNPSVVLVIEGHSDERGTREYNLALAARRADAVRAYLMTQGISAARLDTVSYGKERPACVGSDEQCWKLNRRAVSSINLQATNGRN